MKKLNTFEKIENEIQTRNPRSVKLEKIWKNRKTQTLEEFLIKFFTLWNNNRNTVYADDGGVQTPMLKRRSLGDIYMICQYYYPEVNLNELLNLLYNKLPQSMPEGFRTSKCTMILKRVWYFNPKRKTELVEEDYTDEYGHKVEFYLDNIT